MLKEAAATLNDQAVRLARDGDYEDALLCFSRAIEIENDNALLYFNLGLTYRDNGEMEKAKEALEAAHIFDDTDEDTIETLAALSIALGEYDEAKSWCQEGISLDEANPHFWNTMGVVLFNEAEYAKAADFFEKAVTLDPYYYEALFNLRDTYSELGNKPGEEECQKKLTILEKSKNAKQTEAWCSSSGGEAQ